MANVTIRDIKVFIVKPVRENPNLVVVKVETSEPGLYGLGCATFAYRTQAVKTVLEQYFKPILIGRNVADIEDIWHLLHCSAYWRGGPIEQNAISGVDISLWDIKGKMAGMPVYDLLGGKCRNRITTYCYANGKNLEEVGTEFQKRLDEGHTHIRIRRGSFGGKFLPIGTFQDNRGLTYDPAVYIKELVETFDFVRKQFGDRPELLHDSHERLDEQDALYLAKSLEPYRLFFLEDLLSPEQSSWFKRIRQQTTVPIAMGELFVNAKEWEPLIVNSLIDYIRVHITAIGGITPARKLAVLAETFGVKTAFHGPTDVTPIGHVANLHLDYALRNFGIQEWAGISKQEEELFPGCPQLKGNSVYLSDRPGLGIDFDEELAAKYPPEDSSWLHRWQMRLPDGTLHTP